MKKETMNQSIVGCLNDLKEFIETDVAKKVKLLKETTQRGADSIKEEYVNPNVGLITLPHKNFIPTSFQVPNILIGINNGNNDASKKHEISVRIQCGVYGSDNAVDGIVKLPDEKGYTDLLNLLERIMKSLTQKAVIQNCVIDTNFSYGIYNEEITYPYCYGYIEFSLDIPTMNRQMLEFI